MRILVCPHEMAMGGSQLNAIELAAAVRGLGHDVLLYGPDGALTEYASRLGLEVIGSPYAANRLSMEWIAGMDRIVRRRRMELVHAYEWGPCVGAAFGVHLFRGTPMVMTVLSMDVPDFLPTHIPLVVGTAELFSGQAGRRPVTLMEPPIDTHVNRTRDAQASRRALGIGPGETVVSIVCRLTTDLDKLQGVLSAIDVVGEISLHAPVRLLVAGDGMGLKAVAQRAERLNRERGRPVVMVLGHQLDPTPVYESADIVLGMGSSAMKGMSFGKPLVVQGASGFWKLLEPSTADEFLQRGWYGSHGGGAADLRDALLRLMSSEGLRAELGRFGRRMVEEEFSLAGAALEMEDLYRKTIATPAARSGSAVRSLARSALEVAKFRTVMRLRARRGGPGVAR